LPGWVNGQVSAYCFSAGFSGADRQFERMTGRNTTAYWRKNKSGIALSMKASDRE
jgi:hypothetical protein